MNNITEEEALGIREIMDLGFEAGFMADLTEGDIFTKPRLGFSFDDPDEFEFFVVDRVFKEEASYFDEDNEFVNNRVINLIVTDKDQLSRHMSYGHTHGTYILR